MRIEIVPATVAHARDLAPRLREQDQDEVWASGRLDAESALVQSIEASEVCWTALLDGSPEIVWGAARYPIEGNFGIVWLLSSDEMYRIPGRFLHESEVYVAKMHETFDTLFNYVHAANVKSQHWLLNLGFHKVSVHDNYNQFGETFILFARSNHV